MDTRATARNRVASECRANDAMDHSPPDASGEPGDADAAPQEPTPPVAAVGTPAIQFGNYEGGSAQHIAATRTAALPPFWKEQPAVWFALVEAACAFAHITEDLDKFRYVLLHLDQAALSFVSEMIVSPPPHEKYEALKSRLISSFAESSESRLRRLLRGHELGNERPSHFLQRLRNIAGGQCSESILRTLFIEQLSEQARSILAVSGLTDLDGLAAQADRITTAGGPVSAAAAYAINARHGENTGENTLAAVIERLDALTTEVRQQRGGSRSREPAGRNRSRGRSGNRGRSTSRGRRDDDGLCYYHDCFGEDARNCRAPCSWRKGRRSIKAITSASDAASEN